MVEENVDCAGNPPEDELDDEGAGDVDNERVVAGDRVCPEALEA